MGDNDFQVGKLTAAVESLTASVEKLETKVDELNSFKIKIMTISTVLSGVIGLIVSLLGKHI